MDRAGGGLLTPSAQLPSKSYPESPSLAPMSPLQTPLALLLTPALPVTVLLPKTPPLLSGHPMIAS